MYFAYFTNIIYFNENNVHQLYKLEIEQSFNQFCDQLSQSILNPTDRTRTLMRLTITELETLINFEYGSGELVKFVFS